VTEFANLARLGRHALESGERALLAHVVRVEGSHYGCPERGWSDRRAAPDQGAHPLLSTDPARIAVVDCPEAEIDIDTPEDWARPASQGQATKSFR